MKKYYFGVSERFGYTLNCTGLSKKEVKTALIDKYIEVYKYRNGVDPREDGTDCYKIFLDELYIEEREFGKVYWD